MKDVVLNSQRYICMLANVISFFTAKKGTVLELVWWKHSFERLSEEYEMAKRKKEALDNLLNTGRISQSTHESFNEEIDQAVAEIERQQRALLEKMNSKTEKLEQQIKTLEMLLADFEIQHVSGEIDEEVYQREIDLLSTGLEVARRELDVVREASNQISSSIQTPTTEIAEPQEIEPQPTESVEATPQSETEAVEETVPFIETEEAVEEDEERALTEQPVEYVEVNETDSLQSSQETQDTWQETSQVPEETQETSQDTEETQPTEMATEEETQE